MFVPAWFLGVVTVAALPFVIWVVTQVINTNTKVAVIETNHKNMVDKMEDVVASLTKLASKFDSYIEQDRKLMHEVIKGR